MYLIPKSARNVKMEIFKGITMTDLSIISVFVVGIFLLLAGIGVESLSFSIRMGAAITLIFVLIALMFPSPIVPDQKMYKSFKIIYGYLGSIKVYRRVGQKHGK